MYEKVATVCPPYNAVVRVHDVIARYKWGALYQCVVVFAVTGNYRQRAHYIGNTVGAPLWYFSGHRLHSNDATNGNVHSLRSRSIWLIQWLRMLIKLRLQCIGNVCCVLLYSTQLCVHTKQWIQQRLHGNGATNGNDHCYAVGVYNSSIWMHLVSSKCVLCWLTYMY